MTLESREFELRDDFRTPMENFNMPKMIKGIYLAATSRGGDKYCPLFQQGTCSFPLLGEPTMQLSHEGEKNLSFGTKCKLGLHRCAALCRGGRSCHGTHPGKDCLNKKLWKPDKDAQPAVPVTPYTGVWIDRILGEQKPPDDPIVSTSPPKRRQPEPPKRIKAPEPSEVPKAVGLQLVRPFGPEGSDPPPKRAKASKPTAEQALAMDAILASQSNVHSIDASSAMTHQPNVANHARAVKDSSIMDEMMHDEMKKKQQYPGRRMKPEPPTLIAKICPIGGELWMGPVPTNERLQYIMLLNPSIQICCFKKSPTEVWVDDSDPNSQGLLLPGTEFYKLEMSNESVRMQDLRKLRTNLLTSMRQGDNAYIHCMTGLCRAAIGGALLGGLIMNEDFSTSASRVVDLRNVQMDRAWKNMGGPWIDQPSSRASILPPIEQNPLPSLPC